VALISMRQPQSRCPPPALRRPAQARGAHHDELNVIWLPKEACTFAHPALAHRTAAARAHACDLAMHTSKHFVRRCSRRGLTSWRSAAKPPARYLNADRMLRGFVCCNGLLGRTALISIPHEPHVVVRTTFECGPDERDDFITVLADSTQRKTFAVHLRLLPRQIGPGHAVSKILLLGEF
jgi:hypothetical protein